MTIKNSEWGLVQALNVEADTKAALISAIEIVLTYQRPIKGFKHVIDNTNTPTLVLYSTVSEEVTPFLVPIDSPEVLCQHISSWLEQEEVKPPSNPYAYGDGSTGKGFKLFIPEPGYIHDNQDIIPQWYPIAFIVKPNYIYYSK